MTCEKSRRSNRRVRCGMDILGPRSSRKSTTGKSGFSQERKSLLDEWITGIEVRGASVGINSIVDLVIAALVKTAKVKPDF